MTKTTSFPLNRAWVMWISQWKGDAGVQCLSRFDSIESFWSEFNAHRVTALENKQHLHVFQEGIDPLWEDPKNAGGGHFKLTARTIDSALAMWQTVVLHSIGEQWPVEVNVTGVTFIRHSEGHNIVKVWLSTIEKGPVNKAKKYLLGIVEERDYFPEKTTFVPHKLVLGTKKKPKQFQPPGAAAAAQEPAAAAVDTSVLGPPPSSVHHDRSSSSGSSILDFNPDSLPPAWATERRDLSAPASRPPRAPQHSRTHSSGSTVTDFGMELEQMYCTTPRDAALATPRPLHGERRSIHHDRTLSSGSSVADFNPDLEYLCYLGDSHPHSATRPPARPPRAVHHDRTHSTGSSVADFGVEYEAVGVLGDGKDPLLPVAPMPPRPPRGAHHNRTLSSGSTATDFSVEFDQPWASDLKDCLHAAARPIRPSRGVHHDRTYSASSAVTDASLGYESSFCAGDLRDLAHPVTGRPLGPPRGPHHDRSLSAGSSVAEYGGGFDSTYWMGDVKVGHY